MTCRIIFLSLSLSLSLYGCLVSYLLEGMTHKENLLYSLLNIGRYNILYIQSEARLRRHDDTLDEFSSLSSPCINLPLPIYELGLAIFSRFVGIDSA